jgi:hypothetical protein
VPQQSASKRAMAPQIAPWCPEAHPKAETTLKKVLSKGELDNNHERDISRSRASFCAPGGRDARSVCTGACFVRCRQLQEDPLLRYLWGSRVLKIEDKRARANPSQHRRASMERKYSPRGKTAAMCSNSHTFSQEHALRRPLLIRGTAASLNATGHARSLFKGVDVAPRKSGNETPLPTYTRACVLQGAMSRGFTKLF